MMNRYSASTDGHPIQPEFLAEHGEGEVGGVLRQVVEVRLRALPQPLPERRRRRSRS